MRPFHYLNKAFKPIFALFLSHFIDILNHFMIKELFSFIVSVYNKDPLRVRKLLMHKKEILKLDAKLNEKGLTIVPLKVYLKGSLVKVEIGLAKGKKNYDKRETLAKKTQQREIEKAMKRSMR